VQLPTAPSSARRRVTARTHAQCRVSRDLESGVYNGIPDTSIRRSSSFSLVSSITHTSTEIPHSRTGSPGMPRLPGRGGPPFRIVTWSITWTPEPTRRSIDRRSLLSRSRHHSHVARAILRVRVPTRTGVDEENAIRTCIRSPPAYHRARTSELTELPRSAGSAASRECRRVGVRALPLAAAFTALPSVSGRWIS